MLTPNEVQSTPQQPAHIARLRVHKSAKRPVLDPAFCAPHPLWLSLSVTGLTGWLTLKWDGCEKSKVALPMRPRPQDGSHPKPACNKCRSSAPPRRA